MNKENTERLLIVATQNEDKLTEIRAILSALPLTVRSQKELSLFADVEEDGDSFSANALLKARAIHEQFPEAYVLSDDSGLCVDALGGAPGIYSARFAGEESDYKRKFDKLWEMLADTDPEDWSARFVCAVAIVRPDGSAFVSLGTMEGRLIGEPRGGHGFGYDPIFLLEDLGLTSAELSPEQKNNRSHRGEALRKMKVRLGEELWKHRDDREDVD
ncbi:MAG: RdgB/HAM1 family non-canonical purine NTP pyrophosphatase [Fastidiosipilaceae bacterium]|jgi:XTP/dITP diphosphohydrolase